MATAKDKLEINVNLARERANLIIELTHEYARIDRPDYGDVGDLVHVNNELMEIIQFLKRSQP